MYSCILGQASHSRNHRQVSAMILFITMSYLIQSCPLWSPIYLLLKIDVSTSSFAPGGCSDGDVLLICGSGCLRYVWVIIKRRYEDHWESLHHLLLCHFLFWKSCIIWCIFLYFHRLCSYLSFCELTTIKHGLEPESSIKHLTFRIFNIIYFFG